MSLRLDQRLQQGRYRIRDRLGQGGMGTVYLAEDLNLSGRLVAIKENIDTSPEAQEQFKHEAVTLASLTHPNLPRVTDHFIEPTGRQYLVMDYVQGEDLRQLLQDQAGPLPEKVALRWIEQVIDALYYMHNWVDPTTRKLRPIIHRDIKPGNIKQAPDGRVFLVDFGLAKSTEASVTIQSARAVTPGYSPAEQYTGGTSVRSDIYALGATLYALTTGHKPPEAPAIATGTTLPLPRKLNPALSRNTERVILRAMQLQPADRYASIAEMRTALFKRRTQHITDKLFVPFTPDQKGRRPNKQKPSGVNLFDLLILLVLLLLLTAGGLTLFAPNWVTWHLPIAISTPIAIDSPIPFPTYTLPATEPTVIASVDTPTLLPNMTPTTVLSVEESNYTSSSNYLLWLFAFLLCAFLFYQHTFIINVANNWQTNIQSQFVFLQIASRNLFKVSNSDSNLNSPKSQYKKVDSIKLDNFSDIINSPRTAFSEQPSIRLKKNRNRWTSHANKQVLDELIIQKELENLKSFIANSEGGRYLLSGYGRFGGTSLIKGAINKAKRDLQNFNSSEGVLLVFYFKVEEDQGDQSEFSIEANEFSFAKLSTNTETINRTSPINDLYEHAKLNRSQNDSSNSEFKKFSLNTPLNASFFGMLSPFSESSFKKRSEANLDFTKFVNLLNSYFSEGKSNNELREIILKVINSSNLPSRIILILDRIDRLEILEALNRLELFSNERISIIAIARNEMVDQWTDYDFRLNKLNFRKWYIPYLWENPLQSMRRANEILFENQGFTDKEAEEIALPFWKYLHFVCKGAMGDIWEELKQAKYWVSDGSGNQILAVEDWIQKSSVKQKAWMFDVLDKNRNTIFDTLFAGSEEKRDRAWIGVYYLVDWIIETGIFSKEGLQSASRSSKVVISDMNTMTDIVINNLLYVLKCHSYLIDHYNQIRTNWTDSFTPPILDVSSIKNESQTDTSFHTVELEEQFSDHSSSAASLPPNEPTMTNNDNSILSSDPQKYIMPKLRKVLAELYPELTSAKRVAEDANLSIVGIVLSDKAIDNWHNILREARNHNKVNLLVGIASEEYPGREDLTELKQRLLLQKSS